MRFTTRPQAGQVSSRLGVLVLAVIGLLLTAAAPAQSQQASGDTSSASNGKYYLSLGDSLALVSRPRETPIAVMRTSCSALWRRKCRTLTS